MGGCRDFTNSTTDGVVLPEGSGTNGFFINSNNFRQTVSCWIYAVSTGENDRGMICSKSGGTSASIANGGWGLNLRTQSGTTRIQFFGRFSGGIAVWYSDTPITLSEWVHVAVIYAPTPTTNDPQIFLNGAEVSVTEVSAPSGTGELSTTFDLYIGRNHNTDRGFDGRLAHLQMWSSALDEAQLKESMYKPGSIPDGGVKMRNYLPLTDAGTTMRNLSGYPPALSATASGATESFDGPPITRFG